MEAVGQPRRGIAVEVPADRVGAVLFQRVERVDRVALGFGHLLAVSVKHQTENDDVLIRRAVEQDGGLGHQRVEPASRLVDRLRDERGRELLLEYLLVLKRIVMLREGHCTGVEPAVDDLRDPLHALLSARRALTYE